MVDLFNVVNVPTTFDQALEQLLLNGDGWHGSSPISQTNGAVSVSCETQTTHCCRLMIKSAEVLPPQHVNVAHADSSQLICEVFLRSLQPIGDVLTFRHRSGTRNNFKTRGHQDRQVVTARRKPKEESCLGGRSIEMFLF